jgi:NAD(P)-dependent dehydrogenase (short-subunit alcohol dehydrogenase family)
MIVLVTGSTDGIGKQTAIDLARLGHHVIVHGRNAAKTEAARQAVSAAAPSATVDAVHFDLSSLADVRRGAVEVLKRFPRLDVLLNNAGILAQQRSVTVDGFEATFAVNHLAPFLLTNLLLPILQGEPARIVNVSSMVHMRGHLDFDDLQLERGYSAYGAYGQSKLANVLFTRELARRLDVKKVTVNALHPGVINTKLLREGFNMASGGSLEDGAKTSVYVATSPALKSVTGGYFNNSRPAEPSAEAQNDAVALKLWDVSARLTGLSAPS